VLAASDAPNRRPFAYNFLTTGPILMRFKIGVRTKKIYKMGLSSKIGTFGRIERGPFGKDRHFFLKQIWDQAANSLLLSFFP
jgi:hypothetical protein